MSRAITFSVVVFTNDERAEAEQSFALRLSAMLQKQFERFELHGPSGEYLYDPLAHDGHHEGHSEPLTLKPLPNARGGAR